MKHSSKILASLLLATVQLSFAQKIGRPDQMKKTTDIQVNRLTEGQAPFIKRNNSDVPRTYSVLEAKENLAPNFADEERQKLITKSVIDFGAFMNVDADSTCTSGQITQLENILETLTVNSRYLHTTWVFAKGGFFDSTWMTGRGIVASNDGQNELVVNIGRIYNDSALKRYFTLDMSTREGETFQGAEIELYSNADLAVKNYDNGSWNQLSMNTIFYNDKRVGHKTVIQLTLSDTCHAFGYNTFDIRSDVYFAKDLQIITSDEDYLDANGQVYPNLVGDFIGEGGMNAKVHDPYVQSLEAQIAANKGEIALLKEAVATLKQQIVDKDISLEEKNRIIGGLTERLRQAEEDYQELYGTYSDLYDNYEQVAADIEALRLYLDDPGLVLAEAREYAQSIEQNGGLVPGSKEFKRATADFNQSIRVIKRNQDLLTSNDINLSDDEDVMATKLGEISNTDIRERVGRAIPEIRNALDELAKNATLLRYTREEIEAATSSKGIDISELDFELIEAENRYHIGLKMDNKREIKP